MSWLRRALGIKTDGEIEDQTLEEPTIKNARRALARVTKWTGITDDILADYEAADKARRRVR